MKRQKINALLGTFEKLARAMADQYKIKVVPSAGCCTDGRVIYFPSNADNLSDASREALAGWLDHEIQHIVAEDEHKRAGKRTPLEYIKDSPSKKLSGLMNVFEDIRIEIKVARQYVGVEQNLKAAQLYSADLVSRKFAAPDFNNFWWGLGCAIIHRAHGMVVDYLPQEFEQYVDAIESEIEGAKATQWACDSWALAERVLAKLEALADKVESVESDEGEAGGEGEAADAGDENTLEGAQNSAGGEGETQEGKGEGETQEGADGQSEDDPADRGTGDIESESDKALAEQVKAESDVDDMMKALVEALKRDAIDPEIRNTEYSAHPVAVAADRWTTPRNDPNGYEKSKEVVTKQIKGMKGKLLNLLHARTESSIVVDQESGDLDSDALATVCVGNKRVYTRDVEGQAIDTAVSILVDQSGSMGSPNNSDHCAYYARLMVVAFAETFAALKIPFEIIGFHNSFINGRAYEKDLPEKNSVGVRRQAFVFQVYKAFNENYRQVKTRLGSIQGYEDNADGEAVLEAAKRLVVRPEVRKILVVVSDGEPACQGTDTASLGANLVSVIRRVADAGIEVIGVGAGTDSVKSYYTTENGASCLVVKNLNKLAVETFKVLRARLLGGGRQQRRKGAA